MSKTKYFDSLLNEWDSIIKKKKIFSSIKPCSACGSKKFKKIFKKKKLNFVICKNCTHVFINPPIKESVIINHFKKSKTWSYWSNKILNDKKQKKIEKKKYKIGVSFIRALKKEKIKILDIGSASGNFVKIALANKWDITAIEPSVYAYNILKKKYKCKIFNQTFEKSKIKEKYDVITCWASFEYSYNTKKFVEKINNLLNKNGTVIFYISGNSNSLVMKILREKCVGFLFNRINYFNPKSLDILLRKKFKRKKLISDVNNIDLINDFINYNSIYNNKKNNSKLFNQKYIHKEVMGYKFFAAYKKK